ncbi:MAG: ferredoxin, partial [Pseudomonadota bacterium]
ALRFEGSVEAHAAEPPCPTCPAPCTTACPVGAFGGGAYDVETCRAHVRSPAGSACRDGGCLARHACPVGADFAPPPAQAHHHMGSFLGE